MKPTDPAAPDASDQNPTSGVCERPEVRYMGSGVNRLSGLPFEMWLCTCGVTAWSVVEMLSHATAYLFRGRSE